VGKIESANGPVWKGSIGDQDAYFSQVKSQEGGSLNEEGKGRALTMEG
jgi:hypothetical protein